MKHHAKPALTTLVLLPLALTGCSATNTAQQAETSPSPTVASASATPTITATASPSTAQASETSAPKETTEPTATEEAATVDNQINEVAATSPAAPEAGEGTPAAENNNTQQNGLVKHAAPEAVAPEYPDTPATAESGAGGAPIYDGLVVPANGISVDLGTYSGTGVLPIVVTRSQDSTAPTVQAYVHVTCDGVDQQVASTNAPAGVGMALDAHFSGDSCKVTLRSSVANQWVGAANAVHVVIGSPVYRAASAATVSAGWVDTTVTSSGSFTLATDAGFTGSVALHLAPVAGSSSAVVEVVDAQGRVGSLTAAIGADRVVSVPLAREVVGPVQVLVTVTSGSGVQVLAAGSGAVGLS